jgi:hypothetical protein
MAFTESPPTGPRLGPQSGDPAKIVLTDADAGSYVEGPESRTRLDEFTTAFEEEKLGAQHVAAPGKGSGTYSGFAAITAAALEDYRIAPVLTSGAFTFTNEGEAQAAMEALRAYAALGPRDGDPRAHIQVKEVIPGTPPSWLGNDAVVMVEYGPRTGTQAEMVAMVAAWRRGSLVSLISTFDPSAGSDPQALWQRFQRWLVTQDSRMTGSSNR